MSTYTDLHNRVKENIVVGYNPEDRVSIQKVKLYNEENEYWGTFKGSMIADDITIHNGVLTDVSVINSTLCCSVLKNRDGSSFDLETLANDVQEMSVMTYQTVPTLSARIDTLSTMMLSGIEADLSYLSDQIEAVSGDVISEAELRSAEDTQICSVIGEVSTVLSVDYMAKLIAEKAIRESHDDAIMSKLDVEVADRIAADIGLSAAADDAIEERRHYQLKVLNTTLYPYESYDFAVNILTANLFDGTIYDLQDNTEIGRMNGSVDSTITFMPFSNIKEKYKIGIIPGYTYKFEPGTSLIYTINGYQLILQRGTTLENTRITLQPTASYYYPLIWDNSEKENPAIGRITGAYINAGTNILISGYVTIDTLDTALTAFQTQYAEFNSTDKKDVVIGTSIIRYNGDNSFSLMKNISTQHYMLLSTDVGEQKVAFGKVYQADVVRSAGTLQSIKVKLLSKKEKVLLDSANGFKQSLSSDLTSITFLSVTPAQEILEKKESVRYQYRFFSLTDEEYADRLGTVTVEDLNTKITQDFTCKLSIDLTDAEHIPALKREYELSRDSVDGKWKTTKSYSGNSIDITVDKASGLIDIIIVGAEQHELIQKRFVLNKTVDLVKDDYSTVLAKSQVMDYNFKYVESEPEITYTANLGARVDVVGPTFNCGIKQSDSDTVKIVVPDKTSEGISRELMFVMKINSETLTEAKVKFYKEDGTALPVLMDKSNEIVIKTNSYITLKLQEIAVDRFILVDHDQNSQEQKIQDLYQKLQIEREVRFSNDSKLSGMVWSLSSGISADVDRLSAALSAEIGAVSADCQFLSSEISSAVQRDHKDISYFGNLEHVDDHEDHHLSCFLRKQSRWYEQDDYKFKYGFMYRLSADQGNLIDATGKNVFLGDNDYIIFNKEVVLSNVIFDDMDMIRDAKNEVLSVQDWICDNFVALSGGNEIAGENKFTGKLSAEQLTANVLSAPAAYVAQLSGTHFEFTNGKIHDLDVTGKLTVHEQETEADVSRLSAQTAIIQSAEISTETVLSATFTDADVSDLSAAKAIITQLTAQSMSNVKIADRDKTLDEILTLSVNTLTGEINAVSSTITADVKAVSTDISTAVSMLSDGISADVNKLSSDLSDDVAALSTSLSTTVKLSVEQLSSEIIANDKDIYYLSSEISSDYNKLSALSTDVYKDSDVLSEKGISAKVDWLIQAGKQTMEYHGTLLSVDVHSDPHLSCFIWKSLGYADETNVFLKKGFQYHLSAHEDRIEDGISSFSLHPNDYLIVNKDVMSFDAKVTDFDIIRDAEAECRKVSADLSVLRDYVGELALSSVGISSYVNKICADISTDVSNLSSGISADVIALSTQLSGQIIDLSSSLSNEVISLSTSLSVQVSCLSNSISADVIALSSELSGEVIKLSTALSGEIDALSSSLSTEVSELSSGISADVIALSSELSGRIIDLSASLSGRIEDLSTSLSTTVKLSVEQLSSEIIANDKDISVLSSSLYSEVSVGLSTVSADLSVLSGHYQKTLSTDIELQHTFVDIGGHTVVKTAQVDQLIILDEVTFDRYRLTVRNGSLNLNKIDNIIEEIVAHS